MMTLGSLFSGAGGFELAGVYAGFTPIWASEIEPFPIRVTSKRFPNMRHLGDITKINGAEIPPVEVIAMGSPCQDLSVANSTRKGLDGARSGLFREAVRIIKEMREATNGTKPTYIIWENVVGAYSSNKGEDFRQVLEEIEKITVPNISTPRPHGGKWLTAGAVMGNGYTIAWRTFDAQYWGVPQRRRRIYLITAFGNKRAKEILFERDRLLGDIAASGKARKRPAGDIGANAETSGGIEYLSSWDYQQKRIVGENGVMPTLDGSDGKGGRNPGGLVMTAGFNGHKSITGTIQYAEERAPCIEANMPSNVLTAASFIPGQGAKSRTVGYSEELSGTLRAEQPMAVIIEHHPNDSRVKVSENGVCQTLSSRMGTGGINTPMIMECYAVGNGQADQTDLHDVAGALNCMHDQQAVITQKPSYSLDRASFNQGQNAQFNIGISEEMSHTLVAKGVHAVCHTLDCRNSTEQVQYDNEEISATLQAKNDGGYSLNYQNPIFIDYIVRRLTPLECCRLQGFADFWCAGIETANPTDEEINKWSGVFETHAEINGIKPKSRSQTVKWLRNPYSDSAEYKMWGNSLAIPCAYHVLAGIAEQIKTAEIFSAERDF